MAEENPTGAADQGDGSSLQGIIRSAGEDAVAALTGITEVSAARVFRDPVTSGDTVVIAAAAVETYGGFGFGGGGETPRSGEGFGGGAGAGGGGHSEGRPVAIIEITPAGVRVRPIVDFTRLGVTVVMAALALWRATRRHH